MRRLVIDSATEACSVALFEDNALIAGEFRLLGRGHAELLVPMIAALPEHGRADSIAVALGPGSFTGIRVGLAAARALAFAWGAELTGYPTLDLVAAQARDTQEAGEWAVAMTGGHGEWFVQSFDAQGAALGPVASLSPETATHSVTAARIAGSQAEALVGLRGQGDALAVLPDARCFALLPPAAHTADIRPLYGRAPDARLPGGAAPSFAPGAAG